MWALRSLAIFVQSSLSRTAMSTSLSKNTRNFSTSAVDASAFGASAFGAGAGFDGAGESASAAVESPAVSARARVMSFIGRTYTRFHVVGEIEKMFEADVDSAAGRASP